MSTWVRGWGWSWLSLGLVLGCGGRAVDDRVPSDASAGSSNASAGSPGVVTPATTCPICANAALTCAQQPESQTLIRGEMHDGGCTFGNGTFSLVMDCPANLACAPDGICGSFSIDQRTAMGPGYLCFGD